ncbi:MAPEG family protein [compost metagenome]|uniref:Glutathione metabolism protein n=1 Tax=Variovorax boronicumulans TaxID=436515 RepID=A0A250DMG4_9BURK|nr:MULTISPECIES: MAPEG family protein [Variovorax]ATA55123.1 glutathione metabolism protein [Variovorax boronicumulans]MDP9908195.1 putative MAPEG superfamily protein [Variovorax boronicumulans]MDP9918201.1 putative MAPEG superfamily protein [Variovorax boronicumulans]PBI84665.1 MAPEG family protein [Variovorax boronicumulans]TSD59621.1 glutathione metabolism protein [Variovorax sp. KBS0712]
MTFSLLTVAYWCVFIACGLPYLAAWIAKAGSFGVRDNMHPRDWAAKQSGWRARANSAQANSFEGLPFFIGAVLIAHQLGVAQARLDMLAVAYVVLRVIYLALYIRGAPSARSAVWALAFLVNIAILFLAR